MIRNRLPVSRRTFSQFAALAACTPPFLFGGGQLPTARELVDRIYSRLQTEGIARRPGSIDDFKAGNPDQIVRGVATVFMATWPVLKRAQKAGLNFVITHEPTFWNHQEGSDRAPPADDILQQEKAEWIDRHGMVVWRFHDHWHARKPEPMSDGFTRQLGWTDFRNPDGKSYTIPQNTLSAVARMLREHLVTDNIRVVGNPDMVVRTISRVGHLAAQIVSIADDFDALIVGEAREFDAFEFIEDYNAMGFECGLIIISHASSEEYGVKISQPWLQSVFGSAIATSYIPTPEPFWVA